MRNCFFGGALHAVLLLQKGHGDQLPADIAGFLIEVVTPKASHARHEPGVGNSATFARTLRINQ
jgi:hypothetical protein